MERDFRGNGRSYRPRRNESREDYRNNNRDSRDHGGEGWGEGRSARPERPGRRSEYPERGFGSSRPERGFRSSRPEKGFGPSRPEGGSGQSRPERGFGSSRPERGFRSSRPEKGFGPSRPEGGSGQSRPERGFRSSRPEGGFGSSRPGRGFRSSRPEGGFRSARPAGNRRFDRSDREEVEGGRPERPFRSRRPERNGRFLDGRRRIVEDERDEISQEERDELRQRHYSRKKVLAHRLKHEDENAELRLNRYISMGGVCSRRDADELILAGRVSVNGSVVDTVGQKVLRSDRVEVDGNLVVPERKVYLVLNKPKDYVTTVEDPLERKTVMSLVEDACKERIYPVGRLDRQTTGVLLFTNDGDLAKKLTHPSYDHKKIYHVFLDKPLSEEDLETVATGLELEDGFIKADEIEIVTPDRMEAGIEIHSGKNRIVRRIFEHFGYGIVKLDRVYFAGITKKDIPRGKWRFLTPAEINMLKVY